jgi:hypothetical protein
MALAPRGSILGAMFRAIAAERTYEPSTAAR